MMRGVTDCSASGSCTCVARSGRVGGEGDVAGEGKGKMGGDGEGESSAAIFLGGRGIGLAERLEQPADLFLGHADTGVGDGETDDRSFRRFEPFDGKDELTVLGKLAGVAEKIEQALFQLGSVGAHAADGSWVMENK